jgi:tetratricopeptide (TPR) repeat protein
MIMDRTDQRAAPARAIIEQSCRAFFLVVVSLLFAWRGFAADGTAVGFEQANKLYEEGKYAEAEAAYSQLLASGEVSAALCYNQGNALYKLGQIGRAIESYRRAVWLSPRDADLRFNLQQARARARDGAVYHEDTWRKFLERLSVDEWTLLTAVAFWVLFLSLALEQWRPELKAKARRFAVWAGAALVLLAVCMATALNVEVFTQTAIVIAGEAEVRNGPLDEAPSVYKVRDGAELEVVDQKDDWFQVLDSAQRLGWLRRDEVILFDPFAAPKAKS